MCTECLKIILTKGGGLGHQNKSILSKTYVLEKPVWNQKLV